MLMVRQAGDADWMDIGGLANEFVSHVTAPSLNSRGCTFSEFKSQHIHPRRAMCLTGTIFADPAPVAELVDALELAIEFRKERWFDSGQENYRAENVG